ncbi:MULTISPECIES: IMPACT family protein [Lysobacter]|uniref:YigZ family protein n=2 Tax=Lysobacter TaxID=68 RepID=A0A3N2RDG2_LYSEN|nr:MULTISPECIES: YigZ family protein [Lysobacter]QQP99688.1 YigZ family protein [Lysobacter enzymogenes]ROU05434.1 YigZ family protein [Lysobacter enzymogenes]WMT02881.1 YigZ family protein [Lysobacter yananisis]
MSAATTLAERARHAIEVKHSRFLALAAPVATPEAALAFLAEVADPAATHNCWAYRIGAQYRFNDDGEPSGTAGRPILAAIDGQGCDQAVVVVTRWYGGIKLGAGGLVRAYGGAAAECLRRAPRRELVTYAELELAYPFADTGAVHATLNAFGADKADERFDAAGARVRVRLPAAQLDALKAQLRDATRNRVRLSEPDAPPSPA